MSRAAPTAPPFPTPVRHAGSDFDGDGHTDDYKEFWDCMSGPDTPPRPSALECSALCLQAFDGDSDNDIDLFDAAEFTREFGTGG